MLRAADLFKMHNQAPDAKLPELFPDHLKSLIGVVQAISRLSDLEAAGSNFICIELS